jgi:hypothetical protein
MLGLSQSHYAGEITAAYRDGAQRMKAMFVLIACLTATTTYAQPKVTIYVGPQTRDGYVDVDSGVVDSLKDIRAEFQKSSMFSLVRAPEEADLVLTVVSRRTAGDSGSVGVPIGGMTMFLPIKRRAIDSILRVGSYERLLTSEDEQNDAWRSAAKKVLKDVTVWVEANRGALK